MKKSVFASLIILSVGLASCTKELDPQAGNDNNQKTEITIPEGYVRLDLSTETKTVMDGLNVLWETGDKVVVNEAVCLVQYDSEKQAYYVLAEKADSYEAFYPGDIYTQWKGVMIPAAQQYREGSFGVAANPMIASGQTTDLRFNHLFGVLHLRVKGQGEIASVNVRDNAGSTLCGYLAKDSQGVWNTWSTTLKYDNVTLNCKNAEGQGVALGGSRDFYIPVPAGEYAQGFTITVSEKNGHAMVLKSSTPRTIAAGQVLHTPDITYAVPQGQVFEYHFDACTLGGDPMTEKMRGYKVPTAGLTGYEMCNDIAGNTTAGTTNLSVNYNVGDPFNQTDSYISSRNLQDFNLLFDMWEYHGYLAGGYNGNGQSRAIFRLPVMKNIPEGKVCKVRLSFRFAWKSADLSTNPLMLYPHFSGSGKVLGYKIDGQEIDIPKNGTNGRWAAGDNKYLVSPDYVKNHANENFVIKPTDMNDYKWHDVEILLGACSNTTVVNMQNFTTNAKTGAFFIDDICAYMEDYEGAYEGMPVPSLLVAPNGVEAMRNAVAQAKSLGMNALDMYVSTSYLYNTLGGDPSNWLSASMEAMKKLTDAGISVWAIHMPYECLEYDDHYFDFIVSDNTLRAEAVNRMKSVMTAMAPYKAKYFVLHPTIHGDGSWAANKTRLIASMSALEAHAQTLGAHIAMENTMLGTDDSTGGWPSTSLCFHPGNMNELCAAVPGMKICLDVSHAIVKAKDNGAQYTAHEYAKALGSNVGTVHLHDSDGTNDRHMYPGYKGDSCKAKDGHIIRGTIAWGPLVKTLLNDCGYTGPMVYEMSTYGIDCIASFSGVADNWYGFVLSEYNKEK